MNIIKNEIQKIVKKRCDELSCKLKKDNMVDRSFNPFLYGFSARDSFIMSLERSLLSKSGNTMEDIISDIQKMVNPELEFINRIRPIETSKLGKKMNKKDVDNCFKDDASKSIYIFEIKTGGKLDKNKSKKDIEALQEKTKILKEKYPDFQIFPSACVLFTDSKETGLGGLKSECKKYNIPLYIGKAAFRGLKLSDDHFDAMMEGIKKWSVEYNSDVISNIC